MEARKPEVAPPAVRVKTSSSPPERRFAEGEPPWSSWTGLAPSYRKLVVVPATVLARFPVLLVI